MHASANHGVGACRGWELPCHAIRSVLLSGPVAVAAVKPRRLTSPATPARVALAACAASRGCLPGRDEGRVGEDEDGVRARGWSLWWTGGARRTEARATP
jgi:hypothetical protein